jgi:RimJ/RimL family protein N-acetyltransferase
MLGASLLGWANANGVVLCSCAVPAADRNWRACLPRAGFQEVDFSLQVSLNGLQTAKLPEARAELREATAADHESIKRIAAAGFQHGRYHADPRFPRDLADRRYSQWMTNALSGDDPQDRVFVLGETDHVQGFYHVTMEKDVSDLRLASVAPEFKGTMLGFDLYASILHVLKQRGVRRVVASISAANTAVMNVFATLGFRFSQPEVIYHWHAEAASR